GPGKGEKPELPPFVDKGKGGELPPGARRLRLPWKGIHLTKPLPPAKPAAIKPTELTEESTVVRLAGPVSDTTVGGAGRFLILHLPRERTFAVFDVSAGKVVKSLPMPKGQYLAAARLDRFVVIFGENEWARNRLECWDLRTLEKVTKEPVALKQRVMVAALGPASTGPLVLRGDNSGWDFLDLETFQTVASVGGEPGPIAFP